MNRLKIFIYFFLIISTVFPAVLSAEASEVAKDSSKDYFAPLNPVFLEYVKTREQSSISQKTGEGFPLTHIPSPVSLSHVKGILDDAVVTSYPSQYDLRTLGLVTTVKDQENFPTCWAFSAYTSLESCLLPSENVDFSECHLSLAHGFDYDIYGAGNSDMTTAYLIRWSGPMLEADAPYGGQVSLGDNYPSAKHVQKVVFLPERTGSLDNDTIKYFVTNHGPVDFAFFWEDGYNSSTHTFYMPDNSGENHRLAIVGWDDDYPADRFTYPPPGNGAFIARNSWGQGFGENGYCYISYYDGSFSRMACFLNAEEPNNYRTIFQYDPLGQTGTWGRQESWGANLFTTEFKEDLQAVGFYATDSHMNYEIQVYKNLSKARPLSGTLAVSQSGSLTYPGYHTIQLDSLVPLAVGERFSVVVKFSNPEFPYAVPVERPIPNHSSLATSNRRESFASLDGVNWEDLYEYQPGTNVCIKAYSQYKKPNITLTAEKVILKGWVFRRSYAAVSIHIANLSEVSIDKLLLFRSLEGGDYQKVKEFTPAQMTDGRYSWEDRYLEKYRKYTYQVIAFDPTGVIAAKSEIAAL
ncbi:MAG: surface layer protein B [bacterium]|nr:surface layer protein B [bacterium]